MAVTLAFVAAGGVFILDSLSWLMNEWAPGSRWSHGPWALGLAAVAWVLRARRASLDAAGAPPRALGLSPADNTAKAPATGPDFLAAVLAGGIAAELALLAEIKVFPAVAVWSLAALFFSWHLFLWPPGEARQRAAPALIALLITPFPGQGEITFQLQMFSAAGADLLARAVGTDVVREGALLTVSGKRLLVGPGCSGLGSALVLLCMVALLLLLARIRRGWSVALLLGVFPVAALVNLLRIFALVAYAGRAGVQAAYDAWHAWAGILFYAGALAVYAPAMHLALRRRKTRDSSGETDVPATPRA